MMRGKLLGRALLLALGVCLVARANAQPLPAAPAGQTSAIAISLTLSPDRNIGEGQLWRVGAADVTVTRESEPSSIREELSP